MWLPHRIPADAVTGEAPIQGPLDALDAQVSVHSALHDAEERLVLAGVGRAAARGPRGAATHSVGHHRTLGGIRRADVQLHRDVGAEVLLYAHVLLGRPE